MIWKGSLAAAFLCFNTLTPDRHNTQQLHQSIRLSQWALLPFYN